MTPRLFVCGKFKLLDVMILHKRLKAYLKKKDIHINEYGHKVIAESIYEFLKND